MHTPCETLPSKASLWGIAAQRQVGETSLNDMSSRSHQIIRLVSSYSPSSMMHTGLVENNGLCKFLWNQPAFHRSWANKRIVSADGGEPTSRYSVWDSSNLVGCKPGTYTLQFRHLISHVLHKVKALRNYLLHKERSQQIFLIPNCYVLAAEFCRFSRKWKSITNSCWRSQTEGRSPY